MSTSRTPDYVALVAELTALLDGERDVIANAANMSALLHDRLADVNWVGFYFVRAGTLVVGPFQGRPACVRIALGQGVCGTAAVRGRSIVVPDVHAFPGHIACDDRSRSEIVVPLVVEGRVVGVLDVDSPRRDRFSQLDCQGLEQLVSVFLRATDLTQLEPLGPGIAPHE